MLRSVLELNCRRVEHGGSFSLVRSIYFDDFQMSAYRESLDGIGSRAKVRLRWYGGNERRPSWLPTSSAPLSKAASPLG